MWAKRAACSMNYPKSSKFFLSWASEYAPVHMWFSDQVRVYTTVERGRSIVIAEPADNKRKSIDNCKARRLASVWPGGPPQPAEQELATGWNLFEFEKWSDCS